MIDSTSDNNKKNNKSGRLLCIYALIAQLYFSYVDRSKRFSSYRPLVVLQVMARSRRDTVVEWPSVKIHVPYLIETHSSDASVYFELPEMKCPPFHK